MNMVQVQQNDLELLRLIAALAPLYVFALSAFVGNEVISKVPVVLHTPLMSGSNAIHGVVLVGAMLVAGAADSPFYMALGFLGVMCGTVNVVGGFMVTDRMLQMFKKKPAGAGGKS